jgi:non-ribosomal peptide synthase protein (TIGR01720 family)
MTEAEAESEMARQAAILHGSLNLQEGPLLRVALFHCGTERKSRLFIAIHHLVVDTVSWQILLEDLQTVYEQLRRREDVTLPAKTTSFKKWAERLTDYAKSDELRKELPEWLALSHTVPTRLPLDHFDGQNTVASSRKVTVSLSAEETLPLLQEVPVAYRSQINEVLLTALVRAFSRWTGTPALLLDLEGHGREEFLDDVDLSRTVGWFTTIFPVALDASGTETPGDALRVVKEQLRKIPNRGIGYGLLRYSSPDERTSDSLRALPQAEVRFNYLGQRDKGQSGESFSVVPGWTGPSQSPKGMRPYLLDIIGAVTNAELRFDWLFSQNLHHRESVEQLAHNYIEELRSLITNRAEGASLSPSDFPNARINQADLNKVLSRLKRN